MFFPLAELINQSIDPNVTNLASNIYTMLTKRQRQDELCGVPNIDSAAVAAISAALSAAASDAERRFHEAG